LAVILAIFAENNHAMKYLLPVLFFSLMAMAQQNDAENDTINLQEVVISNTAKKLKIKTEALRGPCYAPEGMSNASEIITLVKGLRAGYLHSVAFHFNEMLYAYKSRPDTFKDTDFELVFYKANEDDTPGEKISHEVMIITVKKEHKGIVKVDLSDLNLQNPENLFVGLKRVSRGGSNNEFYIDCLCNGLDKYTTLTRKDAASPWKRNWVCAAIKVDVGILIEK
jgi:hypothetical protein